YTTLFRSRVHVIAQLEFAWDHISQQRHLPRIRAGRSMWIAEIARQRLPFFDVFRRAAFGFGRWSIGGEAFDTLVAPHAGDKFTVIAIADAVARCIAPQVTRA